MNILTRRNWIALASAGVASWSGTFGFASKEFWDTKDPDEWSADEIAKLLMKSPWAKTVSGERTRRVVGMGAPRSRIPGTGVPRGRPPQVVTNLKGTVVWESAAPVRAALKTKLPDGFEGQYVLGMSGVPLAKTDSKAALDRLCQLTTLEIKNRQPLQAAHAQVQRENGAVYLFAFPKEALPISRDEKEVVFTTHMGNTLFTAKFNPKDMLYHGELSV
jgi:hypothetical protein